MAVKNGALLGRDDLLSEKAFATVEVDAGGGRKLRLRHLSAEEMLAYAAEERANRGDGEPGAEVVRENWERMARIICRLAVDESGSPIFTDEDAAALYQKVPASLLSSALRAVIRATNAEMAQAGER